MAVNIKKGTSLESMSMTPLIDVVFLLLIFFLVSTRFEEEERMMDIHLPEASEAVPLVAAPQELIVNVDREGRYFVYGKECPLETLEGVLTEAWNANPTGASVMIRGDKASPFGRVMTAANLCKKIGLQYNTIARDE